MALRRLRRPPRRLPPLLRRSLRSSRRIWQHDLGQWHAHNSDPTAVRKPRGGATAGDPLTAPAAMLACAVQRRMSSPRWCVCVRVRALCARDYAVPEWVQAAGRFLSFLRSRNRAALAFKRRCAGATLLIGLAFWAYRRWQADQRRKAKSAALALEAQEAAARGQRFLSPSPEASPESRKEEVLSLGDRFMESHPPANEGALIPVETSEKKNKPAGGAGGTDEKAAAQKHRVAVDALFFSRLRKILSIAVPSVWSTEFRYLTILTGLLFARTFFSIYIAELIGMNAQSMVSRKWGRLWKGLKYFAIITIPASAVNAGLKYYQVSPDMHKCNLHSAPPHKLIHVCSLCLCAQEMTSLRFRKRLSEHVHEQYVRNTSAHATEQRAIDANEPPPVV